VKHGASAYRNGYCRCQVCTDDNTARARRERVARRQRLAADRSLVPHGDAHTYTNWGCRCEPCSEANAAGCAARRVQRMARRV
jgi:hypothetical protein